MNEDIRQLERLILNMRPSGIIQTQIVDALKAILWIFQQSRPQDKIPKSLATTIEELKKQAGGIDDKKVTISGGTDNSQHTWT
jgi:hypothetical protein